MTSTSSFGSSVITLQFALDLDIDVAEQEVQAAINAAGTFLPRDLPNPPIYSKINPADAPILTLALTSTTLPLSQGRGPRRHAPRAEDLAAARRRPREHQRRPEAGGARAGEPDRARRLRPQPRGPAHRRSPQANVNQAKGNFDGPQQAYTIGANDQLTVERRTTSRSSSPTATARRCGSSDVADVVDDAENVKQAAWMNTDAGGDREHPAPARRQHHQRRRPHQGAAAAAHGVAARRRAA